GDLLGRAGHDDPIERCGLRPALVAVADAGMDIGITQLLVDLGCTPAQRLMDLDRVDFLDQPRKDRRLIARPRADLVDAVGRPGVERLGHEGDIIRRSDRLTLADRDRLVVVGQPVARLWEETVPGNRPKRFEHPGVLDPALHKMALDHPIPCPGGRISGLRRLRARASSWIRAPILCPHPGDEDQPGCQDQPQTHPHEELPRHERPPSARETVARGSYTIPNKAATALGSKPTYTV